MQQSEWVDREIKTAKLSTRLEGEALATWLELDEEKRKEYEKVKEKMVEILMPTGFVTFDQYRFTNGNLPGVCGHLRHEEDVRTCNAENRWKDAE